MTAVALLGPTSTSELETLKCPRKYLYRYERKLVPKTVPKNMAIGIFFHACAAEGYKSLRDGASRPNMWLAQALAHSRTADPVDRDGIPLALEEEDVEAIRDMLCYYWDNVGRYDEFAEILVVDEERFFEFNGWNIRITVDLAVRDRENRFKIIDHKTSGDIGGDMSFLPLDVQMHLYYLGNLMIFDRRPDEFIHNYIRRFDFASDQRVGPPSWARLDGTKPYLYTKSGKIATRSDDVNDYLRRVRTPLQPSQIEAFKVELVSQLQTLRFHQLSGVWPRYGSKMNTGCSNCAYYPICTTEAEGREVNPVLIQQSYTVLP